MQATLGVGNELIRQYTHPYIYLNHEVMAKNKLNLNEVEQTVARILTQQEGVHSLVSTAQALANQLPATHLNQSVLFNSHAERSGDLFVIFEPHWFINDFDGLEVATTHGSPWRYDQSVPMIFAGHQITPSQINHPALTIDIAPTVSQYLGIKPPSGATGTAQPLHTN